MKMKKNTITVLPANNVANDCKNDNTLENPIPFSSKIKEMWSCFCHTTTLPGLVQICTSKSKAAQLFWLAMLLAGACITAEQSYRIVQQYLRFGVVEKRYKELEISAVMPTVTVCSNFLLNPQEQLGNTLWMSALEEIQLTPGKPNIYREQRFTKIITSYLKDLPMDERIKAGYRFSDVILECKYGAEKCKSTGVFHSLVYGNCFSLNSPSAKQGVTTFEVLEMILNSPLNIFSNSSAYVGPVAIIHEPNTAPAVQPYNAIYIYPRKWLSIKFQRSEFYRLKSPYASHCVDGDDEEARRQSYYYTETTPYEYSWEACTRTCLQRESYLRCRCYAKSIPSPANVNSTGAKLCGGDICSKLADMSVEFCNCPPRCKEITYSRTVEIDAQRFEDGDIKDWINYYVLRRVNKTEKPTGEGLCGLSVSIASSYVEIITEVPEMEWTSVLGSIGGSLGLWIGISILSLGELLGLFVSVIYMCFNHVGSVLCQKQTKKQKPCDFKQTLKSSQ